MEVIDLPKILNDLFKLIEGKFKEFPPPEIKEVIMGLVYSGVRLSNDQMGTCQSMVNFYTPDCFHVSHWGDLSSYTLEKLVAFSESSRLIDRVVGIAAINAFSQHIFEATSFQFNFEDEIISKLDLKKSDKLGMVGMFTPMIPKIIPKVKDLTIVELDQRKLKNETFQGARITDDNSVLENVDVAIITGTSLINNTIDDLIKLASSAKIAVIGPTMGMLPDTFFKAGVDVIGGMKFIDVDEVMRTISQGQGTMRFKKFARKYIIEKENYQMF